MFSSLSSLGVEMLFEIQKPRLTPRFLYFKQLFSTSEVIIQQTRKRKQTAIDSIVNPLRSITTFMELDHQGHIHH
jgi:hypothetical protein